MNTSSKAEIVSAMNVLVTRRGNTTDAAEKAVINEVLKSLSESLQDLDHAALLEAAQIVANATDELEKVVAAARVGPFDSFLSDIQSSMQRLQHEQAAMHAVETLPAAEFDDALSARAAPVSAADATPRPIDSKVFDDLRAEYQDFFDRCQIRTEFAGNVDFYVSRLLKFRDVYRDVATPLGIPWFFIGILHGMECGFDFATHLHNGDVLTARTVHVPKGRPATGMPPFSWRESARDALILKGYNHESDWTLPRQLYLFEKYNGFGYRPLGVPSPYLWSFSNLYTKGKFVGDHEFNPEARSRQCGTALMIKALQSKGAL